MPNGIGGIPIWNLPDDVQVELIRIFGPDRSRKVFVRAVEKFNNNRLFRTYEYTQNDPALSVDPAAVLWLPLKTVEVPVGAAQLSSLERQQAEAELGRTEAQTAAFEAQAGGELGRFIDAVGTAVEQGFIDDQQGLAMVKSFLAKQAGLPTAETSAAERVARIHAESQERQQEMQGASSEQVARIGAETARRGQMGGAVSNLFESFRSLARDARPEDADKIGAGFLAALGLTAEMMSRQGGGSTASVPVVRATPPSVAAGPGPSTFIAPEAVPESLAPGPSLAYSPPQGGGSELAPASVEGGAGIEIGDTVPWENGSFGEPMPTGDRRWDWRLPPQEAPSRGGLDQAGDVAGPLAGAGIEGLLGAQAGVREAMASPRQALDFISSIFGGG